MIIVIAGENTKEVQEFIFQINKASFVKFNFQDAKDSFSDIFKNLRISSSEKYTPFRKIVNTILASDKTVLVSDCTSNDRANVLREMKAKFIHICTGQFYKDGDLYIEKKPKTIPEMTRLVETINLMIYGPPNVLYQSDSFVITEG